MPASCNSKFQTVNNSSLNTIGYVDHNRINNIRKDVMLSIIKKDTKQIRDMKKRERKIFQNEIKLITDETNNLLRELDEAESKVYNIYCKDERKEDKILTIEKKSIEMDEEEEDCLLETLTPNLDKSALDIHQECHICVFRPNETQIDEIKHFGKISLTLTKKFSIKLRASKNSKLLKGKRIQKQKTISTKEFVHHICVDVPSLILNFVNSYLKKTLHCQQLPSNDTLVDNQQKLPSIQTLFANNRFRLPSTSEEERNRLIHENNEDKQTTLRKNN
ncbi:hypothetical protein ABK040_010012 [Willaertia magna]